MVYPFFNNIIMKKYIIFLFFVIQYLSINAVPAKPIPFTVSQNDGSELTVLLYGDENFHYATTLDGVPIMQGQHDNYYYVRVADGKLSHSNIIAHNENNRTKEEKNFINNFSKDAMSFFLEKRIKAIEKQTSIQEDIPKKLLTHKKLKTSFIGKKKGLVILVDFADLKMDRSNPQNEFNMMFNKEGYNNNDHIGSVHDYFYDQSYGQFDLSFDVVGPITMSKPYFYYGENDDLFSRNDIHIGEMVSEACILADKYVDFKDYDWDNDGEVEQVFLIYAGFGEASGGNSNTIWPHKFSLSGCKNYDDGEGPLILDGVKIDIYACSCELADNKGNTLMGIGTACHEFSHCLGLPDIYDVKYKGGFGMQKWDLMDAGSYNGPKHNGEVPVGYSAYERWMVGWLEPIELMSMSRITDMYDIGNSPTAYIIYNNNHQDEYFILENRQNERWFSNINSRNDCHGMLITHVDYLEAVWKSNKVNIIPRHQRLSLVPADNSYGELITNGGSKYYKLTDDELAGDLFPGIMNVREFTNISHEDVGGRLFNKNTDGDYYLNKPITNIKEKGGRISFDFMGGIFVPVPHVESIEQIGKDAFVVKWDIQDNVDSCVVEIEEIRSLPSNNLKINENFQRLKTEDNSEDDQTDISFLIGDLTSQKGWKGRKLFRSKYGVKVNGCNNGYIQTPKTEITENAITLKVRTKAKIDSCIVRISVVNENKDTVRVLDIKATENITSNVIVFNDLQPGKYFLHFSSLQDFYICGVFVYDGSFTEEQINNQLGMLLKPLDSKTQTVTDCNQVIFTDLKAYRYRCRIKAMKDEASSKWTDYNEIKLSKINGIKNINKENEQILLYDINGNNMTNKPWTKGIRIVVLDNKVRKVCKYGSSGKCIDRK